VNRSKLDKESLGGGGERHPDKTGIPPPCCLSFIFWLNNDAHLQKAFATLAQKGRDTYLWKQPNSNDQTFHAMPRQKAYTGDALLSQFEQVFLSLSKAKKKKHEAVIDAAEYGYPPYSAAQQIKVEHESSQVQQLHNLLERKTRQAHSERVLLSELCFALLTL
jgi:hypothetical protein